MHNTIMYIRMLIPTDFCLIGLFILADLIGFLHHLALQQQV